MKGRILIERIPWPFAPLYEKAANLVTGTTYAPLAEEIISHLREGLILDLGTGPGYLPIAIARRNPSVRIIGIDLSGRLIRTALKLALQSGLTGRLTFETGNAASLRFQDSIFDMVISTGMFHSLKNPVRVLQECWRVLKNGGQVWIWDPAQVSSRVNSKEWLSSLTPWERFLTVVFRLYGRFNRPHEYTREEVLELVHKTPFEIVELRETGGMIRMKLKKMNQPPI